MSKIKQIQWQFVIVQCLRVALLGMVLWAFWLIGFGDFQGLLLGICSFAIGLGSLVLLEDTRKANDMPNLTLPNKISMSEVARFGQRQCVYVIYASNGLYKIGMTKNAYERIAGLRALIPNELWCVALVPTGNARELERALHSRFNHKHKHGEWFALDPADIEYIKSL